MVAMLAVGPLVSAKPMSRDFCLQRQMQTRALASNGLSRDSASKAQTWFSSAHARLIRRDAGRVQATDLGCLIWVVFVTRDAPAECPLLPRLCCKTLVETIDDP